MTNRFLVFFVLLLSLSSCLSGIAVEEETTKPQDEIYPITVEVELPCGAADSKSSFTDDELNRITDLNVFVYHDGSLLEEYSCYFTDMTSLMLSFPYDRNGFNIYMFGNVGKIEAPEDESDISDVFYAARTYEDFKLMGFPLANVFPDHVKGTLATFRLKRLVGQYNIVLRPSAETAQYHVKDVRLMNCALDVYPFGEDTKASKFAAPGQYDDYAGGDVLTPEDIAALNDGQSVSLYFIENLQGELLPGNTDRTKKIPSSLDDIAKGLSDRCTYIEITADITTSAAQYTDGKFRFYLGQNETSDFSIKRNTLYNVTLDFTQNMVNEQEWRIEVGEPVVKNLNLSKEEVHVVRGVSDYILMDGPRMRINLEKSNLGYSSQVTLSDVTSGGKTYQKLLFVTDEVITGLYDWKSNYKDEAYKYSVVLDSVEEYNGTPLIRKSVTAYVYYKAFPIVLRMNENGKSSPYQVEALTSAPVNMDFQLSAIVGTEIESSGSTGTYSYSSSASSMSRSTSGHICCSAGFASLYDKPGTDDGKSVRFKRMDVTVSGKKSEYSSLTELYVGDGGKAYWGPGSALYPQKFSSLSSDSDIMLSYQHTCSLSGCILYEIKSGSTVLFKMAPYSNTCSSGYSTGTSNSLVWDVDEYNSGRYIPFYILNGGLDYAYPVTIRNESAKYLDDSARKSIIYEMCGPGRDVFYPNGISWGDTDGISPSNIHKFGYTAGLVKQFFGNIHTWQIYQNYECDFYMTVNGCTIWPGASRLSSGFRASYDL